MQIESRLLERSGQAVTNFPVTLPGALSDLARESLKDPYRFDFLRLTDEAQERSIEDALTQHLTEFLIELGAGFAYVGRQVLLDVGGDEFFSLGAAVAPGGCAHKRCLCRHESTSHFVAALRIQVAAGQPVFFMF